MKHTRVYRILSLACGSLLVATLACALPGAQEAPVADDQSAPGQESPAEDSTAAEEPQSAPAGACDNPLFPVKEGATWNYNMSDSQGNHTFTRTILAVDAAGFSDQDVFSSGTVRTSQWECDHGNLISLNPGGGGSSAGISTGGETMEYTTTQLSGVTLPASVKEGDSWSQSISLEGNNTISGISTHETNDYTSTCTAGATESVSVPAGAFEALAVTCDFTMLITVEVGGASPAPMQMNVVTTSWYAPGVGWVKSVSSGEGMDTVIELTSYSIP
jgi:hypothetical protein